MIRTRAQPLEPLRRVMSDLLAPRLKRIARRLIPRRLHGFAAMLAIGLSHPRRREFIGFVVLDGVRRLVLPSYQLGEYAKLWHEDDGFFRDFRGVEPSYERSAERKYFLRSLLRLVEDLPGDTAEAGVFQGASSWFICQSLQGADRDAPERTHHAFDSFEGLPAPRVEDGTYWEVGDIRTTEDAARALLAPFRARIYKGWIPACFEEAAIESLCFGHIDVDLYEPTLESMRYFYPRLVSGGILMCDDYGSALCPGATRAVDEFMADKPERVVHAPTGQAFIIKR